MSRFDELKHRHQLFLRERVAILTKELNEGLSQDEWLRLDSVERAIKEIEVEMDEILADDPLPCASDDAAW